MIEDKPGADGPKAGDKGGGRADPRAAALRGLFRTASSRSGGDGTANGSGSANGNGSRNGTAGTGARDAVIRAAVVAGFDSFTRGGVTTPASGGTGAATSITSGSAVTAAGAARAGTAQLRQEHTDVMVAARQVESTGVRMTVPASLASEWDDPGLDDDVALAAPPAERKSLVISLSGTVGSGMTQAGEMVWLTLVVFKSAIVHPRGYWGEVKDQMYSALKLCFIPMVISLTAFGIGAPGLQGGNIFSIFGIPERLGSFVVATGIREFAPWIDAMLVAGVVGTAITADIGARRIREEIDAMEVLGVDPIRSLILPRVISTAIITGLFDILASLVGIGAGYIASCLLLGASPAGFIGNFFSEANVPDLVGSFVKTFIFGLIIGIVCCYKGMKASGGAAGVGRAVNSAVVISFAMVWIVNYIFTNTLLGLFPSTQVFR
jgi:phospholipid/cholesterol/gamma-HCH transport system permease protein